MAFFIFNCFLYFSADRPNDSFNYYTWALHGDVPPGVMGTGLIVLIVKFFLELGIKDYFSILLIFSGISAVGIVVLFNHLMGMIQDGKAINRVVVFLFFLIPGFHFWTVAIGKDALSIAVISFGLVSFLNKKYGWLALNLIALFLIRSHIAS